MLLAEVAQEAQQTGLDWLRVLESLIGTLFGAALSLGIAWLVFKAGRKAAGEDRTEIRDYEEQQRAANHRYEANRATVADLGSLFDRAYGGSLDALKMLEPNKFSDEIFGQLTTMLAGIQNSEKVPRSIRNKVVESQVQMPGVTGKLSVADAERAWVWLNNLANDLLGWKIEMRQMWAERGLEWEEFLLQDRRESGCPQLWRE